MLIYRNNGEVMEKKDIQREYSAIFNSAEIDQ